jgi:hypothetical protein
MTKCEYCGQEIGLLEVRYTWIEKGKRAIHDDCIKKQEERKKIIEQKGGKITEEIKERIIGLNFPGFFDRIYNLILTDKRIIGEFIGDNVDGYFFGGVLGGTISDSKNVVKSRNMRLEEDPDVVLSTHENNFEIYYTNIDEIIFKKRDMIIKLKEKQPFVGKKPAFDLKHASGDVVSAFMKILPDKVAMK